jgi:hydrogenase maturation protein HypF
MKATVALRHRDQMVVSPHIGDIETVASEAAFEGTVQLMEQILDVKPVTIACDLHPDYATTRYARRRNPNPVHVQHHHAHILAVMAEYGLTGPVLGVAWDGTGYGDDGTIWGGEFLRVDARGYQRVAHLRTFPLPGGDAAVREPRRSALGVLHELGISPDGLGFTPAEQLTLTRAMEKGINTLRTSSAGRLFDAAAALLGICHKSSYEGHAAMLLQAAAEQSKPSDLSDVPLTTPTASSLDWAPLIHDLLAAIYRGDPIPLIAARFHQALVELICAAVALAPDLPVVLAGGCFQNSRLLAGAVEKLESMGRKVYWPHILPPNDGAISAGQVMAGNEGSPQ